MHKFQLPIFVINLERDISKKKYMQAQAKALGLDFKFVPAIVGNDLSEQRINSFYDPEMAKKLIRRELSKPEIGCALSHRLIYQRMVSEGITVALILEDDAELGDQFAHVVGKALGSEFNWETLLLGSHIATSRFDDVSINFWKRSRVDKFHAIGIPAEIAFGTYGYLIKLDSAKRLLQATEVVDRPIDHITGDYNISEVNVLSPSVVHVHENLTKQSNISGGREDEDKVKRLSGGHYRLRKKIVLALGLYDFYHVLRRKIKVLVNRYRVL